MRKRLKPTPIQLDLPFGDRASLAAKGKDPSEPKVGDRASLAAKGKDPSEPKVGDQFQLTGKFLKSTGQLVGGEGQNVWRVVDCECSLCASGNFVASDERSEIESRKYRHFHKSVIFKKGTLTVRNDP